VSTRWLGYVWEHSPYKGAARLIHLAIADNANDAGECWPHLPTIIRKANISQASAYEALKRMQADGVLRYDGAFICRPGREHPLILVAFQNLESPVQNLESGFQDLESEAVHTSLIRTIKEPSVNPPRAVTSVTSEDAEFEYWWTHYPKRVGKGSARLAYRRALRKFANDPYGAEQLLQAVQRYAASRRGQDKQYTLNPTTWLNQERWDDEIAPSRIGVLPDAPMPDWMKKIAKEQP